LKRGGAKFLSLIIDWAATAIGEKKDGWKTSQETLAKNQTLLKFRRKKMTHLDDLSFMFVAP